MLAKIATMNRVRLNPVNLVAQIEISNPLEESMHPTGVSPDRVSVRYSLGK